GLKKAHRLALNQPVLDWSRSDPGGLLAAARQIAAKQPIETDERAKGLFDLMTTESNPKGPQFRHDLTEQSLAARPEDLVEADPNHDASGHRQGQDVNSDSPPVRRGGRDASQQQVGGQVADHPGERLHRGERAEDGPLFALRGDPREQPGNGRTQQSLAETQE